jgi:DNA primase
VADISEFGFDAKEQIRQAIDIVDLAASYLDVRRQGPNYKALCPWHDDSRPSLQFNQQRQIFKCFVCDVGGDIFSFVMKMENVDFREALEILAERAGIALIRPQHFEQRDEPTWDKRQLFKIAAWAESEYHRSLREDHGALAARNYLRERGITEASIKSFRLGHAPDQWDWLIGRARKAGVSLEGLEKIGLIGQRTGGAGHFDRFRGRVLFSIRDVQGRPVALGGRILPGIDSSDAAKYINSPETPLFSKNSLLYGLDTARDVASKSREIIVMEGYTDCIIARQEGFGNVVAVLGTALGERHLRLLRRFADRVLLVLDGDEAGKRRSTQLLELFVAEQMDLRILTLPDELDPCDFIRLRGREAFRDLLQEAVDALEHKIRVVTEQVDPAAGDHQANAALEEILGTLSRASAGSVAPGSARSLRVSQLLFRLASRFRVSEESLRRRLADLARRNRNGSNLPLQAIPETRPVKEKGRPREEALLEVLLIAPQLAERAVRELDGQELDVGPYRDIYHKCAELVRGGEEPDLDRLLIEFDDPDVKQVLVSLHETSQAKRKNWPDVEAVLDDVLADFRQRSEQRALEQQRAKLQEQGFSEEEELQQLLEIQRRQQLRHGINAPMDG